MYNIIEIANTHGGSKEYVLSLIHEFERFQLGFGIKFQPLFHDEIATIDYEYYTTYKELYFTPNEWKIIIEEASKTKDIWLDIFDFYGIQILKENLLLVKGIKLQASVLNNYNVIENLATLELEDKLLVINISGYELDQIETIFNYIERRVKVKDIILQIGFQSYPTEIWDIGFSKISILQKKFPKRRICLTEHIDSKLEEDTVLFPAISTFLGVDYVEKHVKHSSKFTKYDAVSAVTHLQYEKYVAILSQYKKIMAQPFINMAEKNYLAISLQQPILKQDKKSGQGISVHNDFTFKRSGANGIGIEEIKSLISQNHILNRDKYKHKGLQLEDFKKANIATIIACRLKSKRLPKKALNKIGNITSIEKCIKSALAFKDVNYTILATSTLEEDKELKDYTYSNSVIFHQGDPIDVIQRYLDVCEIYKIDVVIRATGDNPFMSNDILQILLQSHFQTGADYTTANEAALGTNMEIINTEALRKVKTYFPVAEYSEYMTWYFRNNPDYFNLNFVSLPEELVRDYRLTLDYPEDLELFNSIDLELSNGIGEGYSIQQIFDYLDNDKNVSIVNEKYKPKYSTDEALIELLNSKTKIK